jgi:hypothetical protein
MPQTSDFDVLDKFSVSPCVWLPAMPMRDEHGGAGMSPGRAPAALARTRQLPVGHAHTDPAPAYTHAGGGRLRGHLPRRGLHRTFARAMLRTAVGKVHQDPRIWKAKRYEPRPRLAASGEAIGLFRHWARQFYPTP